MGGLGFSILVKKLHLVNWSIVCLDKSRVGLGIKNISMLNKSFLGTWCLRFVVERDRSWRQVISAKFGEKMGGWCSHEGREW